MNKYISIRPEKIASYGRKPAFRAECAGFAWNFRSANQEGTAELQRDAIETLAAMVFTHRGPGLLRWESGDNYVEKL